MVVRIGSFNCENFFSRASLLNSDNPKNGPLLDTYAQLCQELDRPAYDPSRIVQLYVPLIPYVDVLENRGQLFNGTGSKVKVAAKGRAGWDGCIELKRSRIPDKAQENTVRVIKAINADVLCTVEMEDRRTLKTLGHHELLKKGVYAYNMLIDGNDPRGINLGLLSRYPITDLRSHTDDMIGKSRVFSRDCPEYKVELPSGQPLFMVLNHLKSQGYGAPAANDVHRLRQSQQVANLLAARGYDLANQFVVVAGDFNATPGSPSLEPLLSVNGLNDLLGQLPAGQDWTYAYKGKKSRIDYLLVSDALLAKLVQGSVMIERSLMPGPTIPAAQAASDHAAICAAFDI